MPGEPPQVKIIKEFFKMNDESKVKVLKTFSDMSTVGKFLVVFIIIFISTFTWDKVDRNMDREETKALYQVIALQGKNIDSLVKGQQKVSDLKLSVKSKFEDAAIEYENMSSVLGEVLSENGITFPQKLNSARARYRAKFDDIKDCLIN